jgi:hypothetical protein
VQGSSKRQEGSVARAEIVSTYVAAAFIQACLPVCACSRKQCTAAAGPKQSLPPKSSEPLTMHSMSDNYPATDANCDGSLNPGCTCSRVVLCNALQVLPVRQDLYLFTPCWQHMRGTHPHRAAVGLR